jgi:hypothetical protein
MPLPHPGTILTNRFIRGNEAEINTGFVPGLRSKRRAIQLAPKFIF